MQGDSQIQIRLVSHYQYCPRRAWLEAAGERVDSIAIAVGDRDRKRVDDGVASGARELRGVEVFNDRLGVNGRVDMLIKSNRGGLILREYKATPIRRSVEVTEQTRVQLALQVLCLQKMGEEVEGVEVYFSTHSRIVPVELDEEDYLQAERVVSETRSCVDSTDAPPPKEDSRSCSSCSHIGICLPDERQLKPTTRRIVVSDPDSQVLYLATQGSFASIRAGQIIVRKLDEVLGKVPIETVQGVQVLGNIELSGALIRELSWRSIPIVWCSSRGRVYGWINSTFGPNGQVRVQQHVASSQGRLQIAREMVASKISNQATQLRRAKVESGIVENLRKIQRSVGEAETWQEILGLEGEAAANYFNNWPMLIKETDRSQWSWSGRTGRPATDQINAMLNFGFALLLSDAIKAILSCGLAPHAGFIHSSGRNKPALALDLMEEFRVPIVDSVVQTVINNHEIKPTQFKTILSSCRMNDEARKSLIDAYERRMTTEIRHPIFEYSVTWRRILEIQARQILGVLDGTQTVYKGVRVRLVSPFFVT